MNYDKIVGNNANTLAQYNELLKKERNPQLGVMGERTLVIVSKNVEGILEKIVEFVRTLFMKALIHFQFINTDSKKISSLEREVSKYHMSQAKISYSHLIDNYSNEIEMKQKALACAERRHEEVLKGIKTKENTARDNLLQLENTLYALKRHVFDADIIAQNESLKSDVRRLTAEVERLNQEVERLRDLTYSSDGYRGQEW